jgi:hypothetical protein
MRHAEEALRRKRLALLQKLAGLSLLLHGSYVERFSTCARSRCACHQGRRHGPRSYLSLYRQKRQRQIYVRQADRTAVRRGLRQHDELLKVVAQLTDINVQLLRMGRLAPKARAAVRRGGRHG